MSMTAGRKLNLPAIQARLEVLKITHAEVGRRLGISKSGASNILTGRQRVSHDRARRLARALRCPMGSIIAD